MIKPAFIGLALAGALVMTGAAQTQSRGAPIIKGVTTGDLSVQVDQTRQQTADLMLQLNQNASDIRMLNGRIEALEFQLGQSRSAQADLQKDNEALARELAQLEAEMAAQSRAIQVIQMVLGIEPDQIPVTPMAPGNVVGPGSAPQIVGTGSGQGPGVLVPGGRLSAGAVGPEGSLGTLPASQLPGEAGPLFALARQRLLQLDYQGAQEAFQSFIDKFGNDRQAGEAHFWLGEALHQQGAFAESATAYTTLIRSFPDDERAPDALARLARAMRLIGDTQRACQALDQLPRRYPNASRTVREMAAVERTRSGCPG
jgi:tol-pal system protein YbgF